MQQTQVNPPRRPRYVALRLRVPATAWPVLRVCSVGVFVGVCAALVVRPATGLVVFWTIIVPLLPLVFVVAPGLWRNVCPMAATNQLPRAVGLTGARAVPRWLTHYGYLIGVALFLAIVFAREPLFNSNGPALALLLMGLLGAALLGGITLKGKGGWCNSVCPLRPLQGLYGQTPLVHVQNSHCRPCVGCTKNCPDLKPATAHRNSLADPDHNRGRQRAVFAGLLPGLILAFYTVGEATDLPARALYFGGLLLWSLGAFALLEAVVRLSLEKLVTLFGAFSLTMFYWFNVPTMVNGVGRLLEVSPPASVSWIGRENVLLLSIVFVVRTFTKDRAARSSGSVNTQAREHAREASARESTAATGPAPEAGPGPRPVTLQLERRSPARRMRLATVTALPRGHSAQVRPGSTLLDCAEQLGLSLEPAPGVGDYAIFVVTGMENLSPPERDECAMLERLGLEGRARLASSAHVQADVTISLEAPLEQAPPSRVAMGGRGAGIARAFQDDSR